MLYVDYNFDLNDNIIIFDKDLRLTTQTNEKKWGNLPEAWKEGDTFKLITGVNGEVCLMRQSDK